MAIKRALVVDDSRTARQSLARLLARHDLEVAFAETGEEALTFLHHELVDVIFMDHTMPGMDGLEAVRAIKSNPRTATIPVMMYTTKGGEVYVSQARALGAVGVLTKQVQPGVLFEMLKKLGLVSERREADAQAPAAETPKRRLTDLANDVDLEYERRALGASVQTQVVRVLEEQHLKLRAAISANQRRFAHEVAAEILEQQKAAGTAGADSAPPGGAGTSTRAHAAATAVLAVALLAVTGWAWHLMTERNAARLEAARLTTASRNELDAMYQRSDGLATTLRNHQQQADAQSRAAIAALEWSLNQSAPLRFAELPFGDDAAGRLGELLPRLAALGFRGRVVLTAQLAPFCLTRDGFGELMPAADDLPSDACETIGHPWPDLVSPATLQSVDFATALEEAEAYPGIRVELDVRAPSPPELWFTGMPETAGAWNALASDANRVLVDLVSESPEHDVAISRESPYSSAGVGRDLRASP